jgi:hypothetical protein
MPMRRADTAAQRPSKHVSLDPAVDALVGDARVVPGMRPAGAAGSRRVNKHRVNAPQQCLALCPSGYAFWTPPAGDSVPVVATVTNTAAGTTVSHQQPASGSIPDTTVASASMPASVASASSLRLENAAVVHTLSSEVMQRGAGLGSCVCVALGEGSAPPQMRAHYDARVAMVYRDGLQRPVQM